MRGKEKGGEEDKRRGEESEVKVSIRRVRKGAQRNGEERTRIQRKRRR